MKQHDRMPSFLPDNFSNPNISFVPCVAPPWMDTVTRLFFQNGVIIGVAQRDRREINSQNFRVTIRDRERERFTLVRKFAQLTDPSLIEFYFRIERLLAERGVPVPAPFSTVSGQHVVEVDSGLFSVFPFVKGNHFVPTLPALASVASAIGMMHRGFSELPQSDFAAITAKSSANQALFYNKIRSQSPAYFEEIRSLVSRKSVKTDADALVLAHSEDLARRSERVVLFRKEINALPSAVIHSDLHPHNIIMDGDRVAAILDFDGLRIAQRARDAACAYYRFGRQFFVQKIRVSPRDLREEFFRSYESIFPLPAEEKELLSALAMDEFLLKTLFVLRGVYMEGNETWAGDLQKFLSAPEEIDYLFDAR